MEKKTNPYLAVLLSMFVLPGLGHYIIGRNLKGLIMIVVIGLYLPIVVFYLVFGFSNFLENALTDPDIVLAIENSVAQYGPLIELCAQFVKKSLWIFLPLIFLWLYALIDLLLIIKKDKKKVFAKAEFSTKNNEEV